MNSWIPKPASESLGPRSLTRRRFFYTATPAPPAALLVNPTTWGFHSLSIRIPLLLMASERKERPPSSKAEPPTHHKLNTDSEPEEDGNTAARRRVDGRASAPSKKPANLDDGISRCGTPSWLDEQWSGPSRASVRGPSLQSSARAR